LENFKKKKKKKAIPLNERVDENVKYFSIPGACAIAVLCCCLFYWLYTHFSDRQPKFHASQYLYFFPLYFTETAMVISFLVIIWKDARDIAFSTLAVLCFFMIYNIICLISIFRMTYRSSKDWYSRNKGFVLFISILGLFDLSAINLFTSRLLRGEKTDAPFRIETTFMVESLSFGISFLRSISFIILCCFTMYQNFYVPFLTVILLAASVFSLIVSILIESGRWLLQMMIHRTSRRRDDDGVDFSPLSNSLPYNLIEGDEDEEGRERDDSSTKFTPITSIPSLPYTSFFVYCYFIPLFPFVHVSFLFHFLTLFGSGLGYLSLKRFYYFRKCDYFSMELKLRSDSYSLNWFSNRGISLIFINFIFAFLVGFVFFLISCLLVILILLIYPLSKIFSSSFGEDLLSSFQFGFTHSVSYFFWVYFPFWNQPPQLIGELSPGMVYHYTKKVITLATLVFIFFEVIFPIISTALDLFYSFKLLDQYYDESLLIFEEKYLLKWLIISFVVSIIGLGFEFEKFVNFILKFISRRNQNSFIDFIVLKAGFREEFDTQQSNKFELFKIICVSLEDIVQLLIKIATVSYFGRTDTQWRVNVAFSIISSSINLANYSTNYIFAKRYLPWIKNSMRLCLFFYFLIGWISVFYFSVDDSFCRTSRTFDSMKQIPQLETCPQISFNLNLTSIEGLKILNLDAKQVGQLHFQQNNELVLLNFTSLQETTSKVSLLQHPSPLEIIFPVMETIKPSQVQIKDNSEIRISFPKLKYIDGIITLNNNFISSLKCSMFSELRGSLEFISNSMNELAFPSFKRLQGTLIINHNTIPYLLGLPLSTINRSGVFKLTNNGISSNLFFETLSNLEGKILIQENHLQKVFFSAQFTGIGSLEIINNYDLSSIEFSRLSQLTTTIHIIGNQKLETLSFPLFNEISGGNLLIMNNTLIEELIFPNLNSTLENSLIIGNSNLKYIEMSKNSFLQTNEDVLIAFPENHPDLCVLSFHGLICPNK